MIELSDLQVPILDMFDPAFRRDPFSFLGDARADSWIAKYQHGYLLLDTEAMRYFLKIGDGKCRPYVSDIAHAWDADDTAWGRWLKETLVALPHPHHSRIRQLLIPLFTPRMANSQRETIRNIVHAELDSVTPVGRCDDFVSIAATIPISVVCQMIGVPLADLPLFARWLEMLTATSKQVSAAVPSLNEAVAGMIDYVRRLISERVSARSSKDDFLQRLVELASKSDGGLSFDELETQVVFLLSGAFGTTRNAISAGVYLGATHPKHWATLAADSSQTKQFAEEVLRYMSPVSSIHRIVVEDIEFRGVLIPSGTVLSLPLQITGRDPTLHFDSDVFNPDRDEHTNLAFGYGVHMCIAQILARTIIEETLSTAAYRLQALHLTGEVQYSTPLGGWGLENLPIAFRAGVTAKAAEARKLATVPESGRPN